MTNPDAKAPDAMLAAIAARLQANAGRGRGRRSALFRWMDANADAFSRLLADHQPTWASVADALAAEGLRDGNGQPPTAKRAMTTWADVQKARAARLTRQPPRAAPARPRPAPAVAPADDQGQEAAAPDPSDIQKVRDAFAKSSTRFVPKPLLK